MTTSDKIIFYGGGAWGQALAIALSNCNAKSSILVSDKKRMESLNLGITKCFPDIIFPKNIYGVAFTVRASALVDLVGDPGA